MFKEDEIDILRKRLYGDFRTATTHGGYSCVMR